MLSKEENRALTAVGPGTPAGELLRRYWQPIAAAAELTEEKPKKKIRVLGEDLLLYQHRSGGYGLVGEHCSHRGVSLYYGFIEDDGIRCPYHGWKYDACGNFGGKTRRDALRLSRPGGEKAAISDVGSAGAE